MFQSMKEFIVNIERTIRETTSTIIKANTKEEAHDMAIDFAINAKDGEYSGRKTEYRTHIEEVPNDYIDRYGNPYDCEDENACWPAGGGLHKDCEYNADALYAYYVVKSREKIEEYLTSKGFKLLLGMVDFQEWAKGNTRITFECYDNGAHLWAYLHTEVVDA